MSKNLKNGASSELPIALAKGVIGAIPWVGALIAEVGNVYLNPLEKRKRHWAEEVSKAIEEIRNRFGLLPEELQKDERFVSFLYHATISGLKNHQRQKIEALRAAVVSSADPAVVSDDITFQYLKYIDELTVTHIRILRCLHEHSDALDQFEEMGPIYDLVQRNSSVSLDRTDFRAFLNDLDAKFLIRIGDITDFPEFASGQSAILDTSSKIMPLRVTSLGENFLAFITQGPK